MMLECFFASESVSSSDALKFGLFFIHSRHFPAHLTTNFRSAIKSGAGETTVPLRFAGAASRMVEETLCNRADDGCKGIIT